MTEKTPHILYRIEMTPQAKRSDDARPYTLITSVYNDVRKKASKPQTTTLDSCDTHQIWRNIVQQTALELQAQLFRPYDLEFDSDVRTYMETQVQRNLGLLIKHHNNLMSAVTMAQPE